REHFRNHAATDDDRLFISKPVLGRVSKTWTIQFSRPVLKAGKFAGVLVLSVSPQYLSHTLENLGLGPNDSAGLLRQDGGFLARSSRIDEFVGKSVVPDRPYLKAEAVDQGVFHSQASLESVRRTFAWRRLDALSLIVYVGLAEADVLAPVERQIRESWRANAAGSLLVLCLAGAVVALLFRGERQKALLARNELMYRSLFEKNASVKLLVDASDGRIVAANPAASRFYGYARTQLEKLHLSDLSDFPPESVTEELRQARQELCQHFFCFHRVASGEIRQVEVYTSPLEQEGRPLIYAIVHDVTERQLLESQLKVSEARYRGLFEVIPDGMMLIDADGEIKLWNSAALNILGVDEAGLKSRAVRLFYRDGQSVAPADYPSRQAIKTESGRGLYALYAASGERKWIAVNTRRLPSDANGGPGGGVVTFADITRVVALEESLLISQSVFDAAAEGIMVTGPDNHILRVNPAFSRITGYSAAEALGQPPSILASGHHGKEFYQTMYQSLEEKGDWEGEVTNRHKDGSLFVERLKISSVRNKDGALLRYVALLSDITVKKRQEEDIWRQAHYDPLTQLPNRTLFLDRLSQALVQAHRRDSRVGVLFIDLDKFKPVNDTYGHQVGDELLRQVAHRIRSNTRDEDTVARLGGDEFVVLLPTIQGEADCLKVADKILESLIYPFRLGEVIAEISASIGIALSPQDGTSAEVLVKKADAAMYQAKAGGRRTIRRVAD
ncbi:MAG: PAS domain S-box protein, partial [Betaproteobacteria bacterium]|nr:PAS domain S-box protein [Betaproteobacteria bacterium]